MDNFNKTDDLYDPNFSIDSNNTEKLDMYGVWLKKKKNTVGSLDSGDSQTVPVPVQKTKAALILMMISRLRIWTPIVK